MAHCRRAPDPSLQRSKTPNECPVAQFDEAVEYAAFISAVSEDSPEECPGYDTKQSEGRAPVMLRL